MTNRNLLHKSKLEQFKNWLSLNGYEWREGKGYFQVIQIKSRTHGWLAIHSKLDCDHFTVPSAHKRLVQKFIAEGL